MKLKEPAGGVPDVAAAGALPNLAARAELLKKVDAEFQRQHPVASVEAHRVGYQQALTVAHSDKILKALKLEEEPDRVLKAYGGEGVFAKRSLAARPLVR